MGRRLPLVTGSTDASEHSDCTPSPTTLLAECTSPQRRTVLSTLCESGSVTIDSLAERVAARRHGVSAEDVDEDAREEAAIGLYHNHLQRLSAAGFVEQTDDGDATTVSLAPAIEPDRVRELIEFGDGNWSTLEAILSNERCRYVAMVLSTAEGALSLDELAEAVAVLERGEPERTDGEFRESVRISLHHGHLPKLAEASVVSYDADTGLVEIDYLPEAYQSAVSERPEAVRV